MRPVESVVDDALGARGGGYEVTVIVDEVVTQHVRWADGVVTSTGVVQGRDHTVIAMRPGASPGVVSRTGVLERDEIRDLVTAAQSATVAQQGPERAPAVVDDGVHAGWREPPAQPDFELFAAFVGSLGRRLRVDQLHGTHSYGYAEQSATTTYLASSAGVRMRHVQPAAVVDAGTRAAGGRVWNGVAGRDLRGVDLDRMGERAEHQLSWWQRRVELPPGDYEVLLSPTCIADLMLHLYQAAADLDAREGRSVFGDGAGGTRVGDRLAGLPLELVGDPAAPGLECAPFVIARSSGAASSVYDNGLPLRRTTWMSDGVLRALVSPGSTPFIDNLILTGPPGARSFDEMVRTTERGLLITSLWYLREVDPRALLLTGMTRDGVYLVEDGEIHGAAGDFRFNESPVGLLGRAQEAGREERAFPREWSDHFTRMAVPPLRVPGFRMSARDG
jgi:predicted Zn-dependent protease